MRLCYNCKLREIRPTGRTYCYECYQAHDRKRYYASREKRLLKDKTRWSKLPLEKKKEMVRISKERHPEKWKARQDLRNAVAQGKIQKLPCEVCGEIKVHAHHHLGYEGENAFKVQWLCTTHHYEKHRKYQLGS